MMCTKSRLVMMELAGGALLMVLLLSASRPASGVVYEDTLDVELGDAAQYGAFIDSFHHHVNETAARHIKGHPVLKTQNGKKTPVDWIHVNLKAGKSGGDNKVTLAIRCDNLYVLGFRNKHGEWFSFLGEKHLISSSTELTFDGGYNQLFDEKSGGWKKLATLPVNRAQAVGHLGTLADFRPASVAAGKDAILKHPLVFFILMVSEAERFAPIRSAIAAVWMDRSPHFLPLKTVVKFVVNWKEFSCALLGWDSFGEKPDAWGKIKECKEIKAAFGVASAEDALSKVGPLLQPAKCSWYKV